MTELLFAASSVPSYIPPAGDDIVFGALSNLQGESLLDLSPAVTATAMLVHAAQAAMDVPVLVEAVPSTILRASIEVFLEAGCLPAASLAAKVLANMDIPAVMDAEYAPSWYVLHPFGPEISSRWTKGGGLDYQVDHRYIQALPKESPAEAKWDSPDTLERQVQEPWNMVPPLERGLTSEWGDVCNQLHFDNSLGYRYPGVFDCDWLEVAWGGVLRPEEAGLVAGYAYPAVKDFFPVVSWELLRGKDLAWGVWYSYPLARDTHKDIVWGPEWHPRWCIHVYIPPRGDQLVFNAHLAPYTPGQPLVFAELSANYPLVCFDGTWNGPKDTPPVAPRFPVIRQILREVYLIMNTVTMHRASDMAPVPVDAINLSTDIDSWAWSLSAEVSNKAALDLIKPTVSGQVEVIVAINGHVWRFLVEGYGRNSSFGKSDFSVSGRSLSAELAAPYSGTKSYIQGALATFSQEANKIVELVPGWNSGSNITIHPSGVDPAIAAGAFSYAEKTSMEALLILSEALGAVISPAPASRNLVFMPRYPVAPWNWGTAIPDKAVDKGFALTVGQSWKPSPRHNGIYVAGTTSLGSLVKVTRLGTNGEPFLTMVTDPLITASETGRERARNLISATGRKEEVTLEMPVLPDQEDPGVLLPGQLLRVQDSVEGDWRGQVMSIAIGAVKAGAVTKVRQSVQVERHYE